MAKFATADKVPCGTCTHRVYPLEAITVHNVTYHKNCIKCAHCNGKMGLSNIATINGKLYCKPHFIELFRLRGTYNVFSDGGEHESAPAFGARKRNQSVASLEGYNRLDNPSARAVTVEAALPVESEAVVNSPENAISPADKSGTDRKTESDCLARIFDVLRRRDPASLAKIINQTGVMPLFSSGADGISVIEFAFTNSNAECGRVMLQKIEHHLVSSTNTDL